MKAKLDINYYKNPTGKKRRLARKDVEEWTLKGQICCPGCGRRGVWASDRNDLEVGPEHICAACNYSFRLPCSGVIVAGVSLQRAELLRAEEAILVDQDDVISEAECILSSAGKDRMKTLTFEIGPGPDWIKLISKTSHEGLKLAVVDAAKGGDGNGFVFMSGGTLIDPVGS